jgi:hypothetical protein
MVPQQGPGRQRTGERADRRGIILVAALFRAMPRNSSWTASGITAAFFIGAYSFFTGPMGDENDNIIPLSLSA